MDGSGPLSAGEVLGPDGPFAQHLPGFAPRPQQQALADAVERTLNHGGPLVGEAGTGVGKTFAYLVPAMRSGARVLISTGGGTPCQGDNMAFMKEHGTVVYLQMPAAGLVDRLRGRADQRPLIAGIAEKDLPEFVAQHLAEREPAYSQAHITVDARHFDGDRMKSVRSLIEGRMGFNP